MLKPIPMAYIIVSNDSVIPTVAIASAPSFETKKMSAMAKTDSMIISRTIGMDNRMIALLNGTEVKSLSVPEIASRMSDKTDFQEAIEIIFLFEIIFFSMIE